MSESKWIRPEWLDRVREEIVEPERRIVDPHHHLWTSAGLIPYTLEDLWADTGSGHKVEKTVFMECRAEYLSDGPAHLRSLGEVELVRDGRADCERSEAPRPDRGAGLAHRPDARRRARRGHPSARAAQPRTLPAYPHAGTAFGHSYDTGHHHFQIPDYTELARCENVVAKLGGLAMPDNGFGWMGRALPPSSDELVAAQSRYYLHAIECFGPDRCMFESNFPVDKRL